MSAFIGLVGFLEIGLKNEDVTTCLVVTKASNKVEVALDRNDTVRDKWILLIFGWETKMGNEYVLPHSQTEIRKELV